MNPPLSFFIRFIQFKIFINKIGYNMRLNQWLFF